MNHFISRLYREFEFTTLSYQERIDYLSRVFLGKPYLINPQGEGADAEFDSAPLYRFDGFDCVTFVNNILALVLSHDLDSFQKKLLQINYYDSVARFDNRFHFMSVDWNRENQKNKIVRDVTGEILDEKKNKIAMMAEGEIDKPNWFLKKRENETADRAQLLENYAKKFKKEIARVAYLPLTTLNEFIFNQISNASVIEIIRPNWNVKDKIGTNLHVSHVGFAIRKPNGELFFRHASSEQKCVVEILLSDYLKNSLNSATIRGINVQIVSQNAINF